MGSGAGPMRSCRHTRVTCGRGRGRGGGGRGGDLRTGWVLKVSTGLLSPWPFPLLAASLYSYTVSGRSPWMVITLRPAQQHRGVRDIDRTTTVSCRSASSTDTHTHSHTSHT